ncbi:hypothetical protein D3C85_1095780 [compost metagenome]
MITGPTPASSGISRDRASATRARSRRTPSMRSAVSIIRDGSSACSASRTETSGRA